MTFTEDNFFKIYYVNIKTFPLLEALPWANWSWLLFLNILYPTTISSDTAGKGNSCKAHDSERLRMTSGHQVSPPLLQRMASGLCCCLDGLFWCFWCWRRIWWEYCCFEKELIRLSLYYFPSPFCFFLYPRVYTAVQNMTGEGWNWEGSQHILKMKTLLFIAGLVM